MDIAINSGIWRRVGRAPTPEELLEELDAAAREQYRRYPRGEIIPTIIGYTADGSTVRILEPDYGQLDRVRALFRSAGAVVYAAVQEGWTSTTYAAAGCRPSEAPDRIEVVVILVSDGVLAKSRIWEIKRIRMGAACELVRFEGNKVTVGRIAHLLTPDPPRRSGPKTMRFARLAVFAEGRFRLDGGVSSAAWERLLCQPSAMAAALRRNGIADVTLAEAEEFCGHWPAVIDSFRRRHELHQRVTAMLARYKIDHGLNRLYEAMDELRNAIAPDAAEDWRQLKEWDQWHQSLKAAYYRLGVDKLPGDVEAAMVVLLDCVRYADQQKLAGIADEAEAQATIAALAALPALQRFVPMTDDAARGLPLACAADE